MDESEYVTVRRRNTTSLTRGNPTDIHTPSGTSTLAPPSPAAPRSRPLPPHMAPTLSQDVTSIAFKISGFYGDESDEKEALSHITQFQFTC